MTPRQFLTPGEAELLKGSVHAVVCGLALVCGTYNAAAWWTRRERHLGINAFLYAGLALWEASHVMHHNRRTRLSAHDCVDSPRAMTSEETIRATRLSRTA